MVKIVQPNNALRGQIVSKFGTARNFGDYVGVHESIVSAIINRRRPLNPNEQQRWAEVLGCEIDIFKEQQA